ncbi:MAG TPA: alpha/beta hydrolase, partial [Telluria sp.]|nr:alpha/beta hydrolase [Telluria sp.]
LAHARVDGFDMPYLEGGQGAPLLLLHGFAGDKDNFTRVARYLTRHYRVLIPDLPGFGDAGRDPEGKYHMAEQARRLAQFLDQLGIGRVHLGGNSMGGFIAAQFAGLYPERVASVWLLDAAGTEASYDNALLRHYDATGEMPLLIRHEREFDYLLDKTTHRRPFLPRFIRRVLGRRGAADFPLHTEIMKQVHASPLLETQYRTLPHPALIVWGERDEILSPGGAEAFHKLFPNSTVRMMSDIGHLPMAEAPRQAAADYLHFRRTLPTEGQVAHCTTIPPAPDPSLSQ